MTRKRATRWGQSCLFGGVFRTNDLFSKGLLENGFITKMVELRKKKEKRSEENALTIDLDKILVPQSQMSVYMNRENSTRMERDRCRDVMVSLE